MSPCVLIESADAHNGPPARVVERIATETAVLELPAVHLPAGATHGSHLHGLRAHHVVAGLALGRKQLTRNRFTGSWRRK